MNIACIFIIAVMLACMHPSAYADSIFNMSIEELLQAEIVSSTSKMSQKVTETPSVTRVIKAQDIRLHGWKTLSEALNSLPGISVVTNRYYDFIGARGVVLPDDHNTRYLMVIDGSPINDALLESAFIGDAFPIDMALIDRIEYVPGAGSVAYGTNAMLGTINITTKSARGQNTAEVEAMTDSSRRTGLRGTVYRTLENGAAILISTTGIHQLGQDQKYRDAIGLKFELNGQLTQDGIAHDLDTTRNQQWYAKLEKDGLNLSLVWSDRTNHPSTAPHGANFDDPAMKIQDQIFDLAASYSGEISRGINGYGNLTYMSYKNLITTPRVEFHAPYDRYLTIQDSYAKRWFAEGRLTFTQWEGHQTVIGIDLIKEIRNDLTNENDQNEIIYRNRQTDTRFGSYLLDEWALSENWKLHGGIRLDHSATWGNHFSPRLGLTWQATPALSVKAIAAKAFRNPNPDEARAGINPVKATPARFELLSNPSLKSESVDYGELIAEWHPSSSFDLSSSLYHQQLHRLIGRITTPQLDIQHENRLGINVTGVEIAARINITPEWQLKTSVTRQHAETDNGDPAPNAADFIAKLSLDGHLWQDRIFSAFELYATGTSSQMWNGKHTHNGNSVISNFALTAIKWLPGAELQFRVNNLFDRKDTVPGSDDTPVANMPVYGRNFAIDLRYAF